MNRDAPRYHPRLTIRGERKERGQGQGLSLPFLPHPGMYHVIFLLAILWTLTLQRLQLSEPLPFHLSQILSPREDV